MVNSLQQHVQERPASGAVLALALAQQGAMAGPVRLLAHGSRLFWVARGWQSRAIAQAEHTAVCMNLRELDRAMTDPDKKVIFLPETARMTEGDIARVCHRHGAVKTLFWEKGDL